MSRPSNSQKPSQVLQKALGFDFFRQEEPYLRELFAHADRLAKKMQEIGEVQAQQIGHPAETDFASRAAQDLLGCRASNMGCDPEISIRFSDYYFLLCTIRRYKAALDRYAAATESDFARGQIVREAASRGGRARAIPREEKLRWIQRANQLLATRKPSIRSVSRIIAVEFKRPVDTVRYFFVHQCQVSYYD